jgi:CheY-like chemotaxis protein
MEAPIGRFSFLLSQTSADIFKNMFQKSANTGTGELPAVQHRYPESPTTLDPLRAFAGDPAKRPTTKTSDKRKSRSRSLRQSVLIVDDVADVTEMIALFLKHAGYDVTTADSAAAALRLAQEKSFDLIISDIGMPEMNGYELAECLRGRSEYQGTPMIAVTGYTEYDDRGRAVQAGFSAHLTKPIDPSDLLNLMNELLG